MNKYEKRILDRISRGGLKIGFDPYNDSDVDKIGRTITTNLNVGQVGVMVIFEEYGMQEDMGHTQRIVQEHRTP